MLQFLPSITLFIQIFFFKKRVDDYSLKKKELGGGGSQKRAPQDFFGVEKQILLHLFCIHKSKKSKK